MKTGRPTLYCKCVLVLFLVGCCCSLSKGSHLYGATTTQRIISLVPSQTELLFAMGFGDSIVAISDNCNYPPETSHLPRIGGQELDLEHITALRPTAIIDLNDMHRRYSMFFHQVGLPYHNIHIGNFTDIPRGARQLAALLDREDAGKAFSARWQADLTALLPAQASPNAPATTLKTYVEIWDAPLQAAGPNSYLGEMVTLAGGEHIFPASTSDFPVVSSEQIIRGDPQIVFIAYPIADLNLIKRREGWSDIKAVRNNHVFSLDYDLFVRPGPRSLEALQWMSNIFRQIAR